MDLLILAVLAIGGLLFFYWYKDNLKNPATYSEERIEDVWVKVKQELLRTSYYEQKEKYVRLDERLHVLLNQIRSRHNQFILDFDATPDSAARCIGCLVKRPRPIYETPLYLVPTDLPLGNLPDDLILYLAEMSFDGGTAKNIGQISENKSFTNRSIEYLINNRKNPKAIFLKGFIFKYGFKIDSRPQLQESIALLTSASHLGVGPALIELQYIEKHRILENTISVQTEFTSDKWRVDWTDLPSSPLEVEISEEAQTDIFNKECLSAQLDELAPEVDDGIAEEIWEAFAQSYKSVMPGLTGKTEKQVSAAAEILLDKFDEHRANKTLIKLLQEQLAIYLSHASEAKTYADCVVFLNEKAERLLRADYESNVIDNRPGSE
ncbi:MAG: hypothetical protein AB1593_03980 [Pseudomonadota bacterium]